MKLFSLWGNMETLFGINLHDSVLSASEAVEVVLLLLLWNENNPSSPGRSHSIPDQITQPTPSLPSFSQNSNLENNYIIIKIIFKVWYILYCYICQREEKFLWKTSFCQIWLIISIARKCQLNHRKTTRITGIQC